jgi:hypothetical protein
MKPLLLALTLLTLLPSIAYADDVIDHKPLHELLQRHVDKDGGVSYAALKADKEDRAKLAAYLKAVHEAKPAEASKKAQLAYYINAYNAAVLNAVIERLPVESVMKVDGFFNKIEHPIAGKQMTLDHLENKIIRPEFKDARVHFVLVCAAKSCPKLQRSALTEQNVEATLNRATRDFIRATSKLDADKKTLTVSKLFEWFADDFKRDGGGDVRGFIARYMLPADAPADARAAITGATLATYEYDWALNAKKK